MGRTGKSIAQIGGTILGGAIGTLIAPGAGTALGASLGGAAGSAVSSVIPDDKPLQKNALAIGPGNQFAGYAEGPLGKDYSFTPYLKDPGTSPLAKTLDITNMGLQLGTQLFQPSFSKNVIDENYQSPGILGGPSAITSGTPISLSQSLFSKNLLSTQSIVNPYKYSSYQISQ